MAQQYNARPSELMALEDPYTAFCLDEACAYILRRLKEGESPIYRKQAKSFHEIYQGYEGGAS